MNKKSEETTSSLDWMFYWSLPQYKPRPAQQEIINKIIWAIDKGYKNIILEAGTGIGKSAIATTLANMYKDSFILTMTKQLQNQYRNDFPNLVEVKGRANYQCLQRGNCDFCIQKELDRKRCTGCRFLAALEEAENSDNVITNYDFFYLALVSNFDQRKLLILDEAHNLERKILALSSYSLDRESINIKFGFDIFQCVIDGDKSVNELKKDNQFWIDMCRQLSEKCKDRISRLNLPVDVQTSLDYFKQNPEKFKERQELKEDIEYYNKIATRLQNRELIIDLPDYQKIKEDEKYNNKLKAEFKPYSVTNETMRFLSMANVCIFLTGTLGSKNKFCKWNNINPKETYYIYQKSPFTLENRPIILDYVGNMSGSTHGRANWKNNRALDKIKEILDRHRYQKGVIHTSSTEQAKWIKDNLKDYDLIVADGDERNRIISDFAASDKKSVLVGASIKDGVDFKGDICRFQIIFKIPYPQLNELVKYRKKQDHSWFFYQAVMAIMQAYGRGIRDMDDYCTMYIIDSSFNNLFERNSRFFNQYFKEAVLEARKDLRARRRKKASKKY